MALYRFVEWRDAVGNVVGTTPAITLFVGADTTLTAVYEVVVEYTLTITVTVGGTTDPAPGSYTYPSGTVVTVTALPDVGYAFDHWELDGVNVGAANPINVTMDANHTLHAVFTAMPPGMGTLEVHAFANTEEVAASVEVVGVGTYTTPFTVDLAPGTYTLNATYNTQTQTKTATITEGVVTRVDFQFAKPVVPPIVPITGPLGLWQFPLVTAVRQLVQSFLQRIRRGT